MNTEIEYIDWLINAKTKYSIGYALDHINAHTHFVLFSDRYTKAQMIQEKFNTLNELDSHLRELRKRNAGIKSAVEKYSQAIINIAIEQNRIIDNVKGAK